MPDTIRWVPVIMHMHMSGMKAGMETDRMVRLAMAHHSLRSYELFRTQGRSHTDLEAVTSQRDADYNPYAFSTECDI